MKGLTLAGILVAVVGIYILVRGLSVTTSDTVLEVGGLKASVEEKRAVPSWVGVAAIVGGLVMVGAGVRKKS